MIVRPFRPEDLDAIQLQPAQRAVSSVLKDADLGPLAEQGLALTAEAGGRVVCIAGLAPRWENRALAWVLLSEDSGPYFNGIHRAVKGFLDKTPFVRVEATVDPDFAQGHRWLRMLGFTFEGVLKAYRPDGLDQVMYSRVRYP